MDAQRNRRKHARNRGIFLTVCAACTFAPAGCSSSWDRLWSKDFSISTWMKPPDPLKVLAESSDGDQRADALRRLREPITNGGTQDDQDKYVEILITAATTEQRALCRLAAIETMQHFKDKRVVKGLEDAYYRAGFFTPEQAAIIKVRAIEAMGETRQPEGIGFLVKILNEPAPAREASEGEKQLTTDERIAAARALGHFKGSKPTGALLLVLQREQDVALRNRAHEALVASTGKELPPDANLWADYLQHAWKDEPTAVVEEKGIGEKIGDLITPVKWWH